MPKTISTKIDLLLDAALIPRSVLVFRKPRGPFQNQINGTAAPGNIFVCAHLLGGDEIAQ
ncbi:hypothetical protein CRENBAI_023375, partial [Crenichthys baileyi]